MPDQNRSRFGLDARRTAIAAVAVAAVVATVGGAAGGVARAAPQQTPPGSDLAASTKALLTNGDFEADKDANRWPDDWPRPKEGALWESAGGGSGGRFLRLVSARPGQTVLLYRPVSLPPGAKALEVTWRWRAADLKPGKEAWYDARLMMDFKDAAGKKLGPSPSAPYLRASTTGWRTGRATFAVPEGARTLEFMPALFQVEKGTLDLDDVVIRVADAASVPAAAKPGAASPGASIRPAEMAPEEPRKEKWPKELRVVGNRVQTADGKTVWLQGMNVVSLEWSATGEHVLRSTQVAVDDWKSNIVRLPVKEEFWFGKGQWQKDGGAAYRALVDAAVTIAANRGAYLLLDLHRFRAPKDEHVVFWKDAAARYRNHPAVLFDLFNEPHGVSWKVWRDGGFVAEKTTPADEDAFTTDAEKAKAAQGFTSPGMQKLVDAVREAGARNVVVAGGLDWAYDLTGVAGGEYALSDRTGNGIVYATHIYPWKSNWKEKVLAAAAKHPILVGEVGADVKKLSFIPESQQEDPYTWAPDLLGFLQKHKLHWTAFSFHPKASPVMITDWSYAPTPFWGAFVRAALRGSQFGMNRMR